MPVSWNHREEAIGCAANYDFMQLHPVASEVRMVLLTEIKTRSVSPKGKVGTVLEAVRSD